jgi:6-pyruvoyltetrahydropterin/6-carboxytetrahydropterin synthase
VIGVHHYLHTCIAKDEFPMCSDESTQAMEGVSAPSTLPGVTIMRRAVFSASHYFWVDAWDDATNRNTFGPTANRFGHGHNYTLIAAIHGPVDEQTGMVANLRDVKAMMDEAVIEPLNFTHLNFQVPFFQENQPTLEALCVYVYRRLAKPLSDANLHLQWVELQESDELAAWYDGSPVAGVNEGRVFEATLRDSARLAPIFDTFRQAVTEPVLEPGEAFVSCSV